MKINLAKKPATLTLFISAILICQTAKAQPALGTTSFATAGTISLAVSGPCGAGQTAVSAGYTFHVRSGANCAINNATGAGSDGHINLITSPATTGVWQEGRFGSGDGSKFRLNTFMFSVLTTPFIGKTITFAGYRNNIAVPGAILVSPTIAATGLSNVYTADFTGNPNFGEVDEVRMTPSGSDAQGTMSILSIDISAPNTALPVEFISLEAFLSGAALSILFSTADEVNVSHYEVQISRDGTQFITQHQLTAQNGSRQQYRYKTELQDGGVFWIRVKANDADGSFSYSKIAQVRNNIAEKIRLFPNPAKDVLNVSAGNNKLYTILSIDGHTLKTGRITNQQIDISGLPTGTLLLLVDGGRYKFLKY